MSFPFHPQALLLCPHSILYLPASPPITPSPYYCQTSILKLSNTRNEIFKTGGNEENTFFSMLSFHWPSPQMWSHRTLPPSLRLHPPFAGPLMQWIIKADLRIPSSFQNPPPRLFCLDNSNSQCSLSPPAPLWSA